MTMWVSPKLAEAYQILRERTWQYRIQPYLEQLSRSGYFSYQGSDIYTDGSIANAINAAYAYFRKRYDF